MNTTKQVDVVCSRVLPGDVFSDTEEGSKLDKKTSAFTGTFRRKAF